MRSNINNTKFAVVGTLCWQKIKNNVFFFLKKDRVGMEAAKAVQNCKHGFKASACKSYRILRSFVTL